MDDDMSVKRVLRPPGIQVYNSQHPLDKKATPKKDAYANFIVDCEEFDIHGAGKRIGGETEVGESVSAFMKESARVAESNAKSGCCVVQ
jgi:hypothetical protein